MNISSLTRVLYIFIMLWTFIYVCYMLPHIYSFSCDWLTSSLGLMCLLPSLKHVGTNPTSLHASLGRTKPHSFLGLPGLLIASLIWSLDTDNCSAQVFHQNGLQKRSSSLKQATHWWFTAEKENIELLTCHFCFLHWSFW